MGETRICIQVCVYVAFVIATVVTTVSISEELSNREEELNCNGSLTYYMDLGCTPVYSNDSTKHCAIKYDCDHVKGRDKNKCYYRDREYNLNDYLTEGNDLDENMAKLKKCSICHCRKDPDDEIAAFECEDYGCGPPKRPQGSDCYMRGDPRKCCYNEKEICPKAGEKIFTCVTNPIVLNGTVLNNTYLDGEFFNVKGEPELTCICQPGHRGDNISPFCVRKGLSSSCMHVSFSHIDYFHKKCAPIYKTFTRRVRCYIKMKCQDYSDFIIPRVINYVPQIKNYTNERVCLLGNLTFNIGDRLRPFKDIIYPNGCINCICQVPPTLSCEYLSPNACDNLISFLDSITFLLR